MNLFKQINVRQNPNDPDDESEHFKQPHFAIEQTFVTSAVKLALDNFKNTRQRQGRTQ